MQLVPCRWSKSGWKYVAATPNFFSSPNRANSIGFSPERSTKGIRSFHSIDQSTYTTAYQPATTEQKGNLTVEKTFQSSQGMQESDVVHWAGGLH